MEPDEVRSLYGDRYAAGYQDEWSESSRWEVEAANIVADLRSLIGPETRWLDAACGTGYFLSQFPHAHRAGFDLSPSMLGVAKVTNGDGVGLDEHDLREDRTEWHDRWDVVSCTGQAWSYVDSMREIERVVANLARWTAPGGTLYIPGTYDLTDLGGIVIDVQCRGEVVGGPQISEDATFELPEGRATVTGYSWSLHEPNGAAHEHMINPQVSTWVEMLSRHFRRIEVRRWPPNQWTGVGTRSVIATEKRAAGDTTPSVVTRPDDASRDPAPTDAPPTGSVAEVDGIPDPEIPTAIGAPGEGEDQPIPTSDPHAGQPHQVETASDAVAEVPLWDRPLSYVVSRFTPWRPGFWRAILRRLRARRP